MPEPPAASRRMIATQVGQRQEQRQAYCLGVLNKHGETRPDPLICA